ncbi:MAG: EAL domain-containing response regulator [Nevskia sp.]|nr:EAL domain-containing response regulator [Nevskia sp.]
MNLQTVKVMIVDDDELSRHRLHRILGNLGANNIQEAVNGEHALALLKSGEPMDLVVTDLRMPIMDGVELIRHLAEWHLARAVIIASGLDPALLQSVETMARAYGLQVLGAIPKPLSPQRLAQLVLRYKAMDAEHKASAAAEISIATMREALRSGEIYVEYQPKVECAGRRVAGVEALARWRRADGSLVPPAEFVAFAEREGLIDLLTYRVLDQACADLTQWAQAGYTLNVAVNISMLSLSEVRIADRIADKACAIGCKPHNIILEVTETALAKETAKALDVLTRLRLKGFGLSIDDFGTGYASMQQLSNIPFTELKIDRSFVNGCAERPRMRSVIETSLELARKLGLSSVAEGVEAREDWDVLQAMGCDYAQGWLISKSLSAADLFAWFKEWQRRTDLVSTHFGNRA